tara:strand:+ start:3710 stop:4717 length:1008 start_codon:yes stop_codon:yes gene_type:complete
MSLTNKEIKFSTKIQADDSFNVFRKYHDLLITEMYYFQQQWLSAAFRRFKDFDKYIILIYLINKAFKGYNDHFVVNSFDEFYSKENFEIPKINIIDLSRELNISKETTRRKMLELEKVGAIKKIKKKVMLQRRGQEIQKPTESIKNLSRVMSHFTDYLTRENILRSKIPKNEIEEKIKRNFTQCWQYFFDYQIPLITRWKKIFGDIETWTIWGNCVYNQNLVMTKNIKVNQNLLKKNDDFIKRLNEYGNQGLNAMTISDLTNIPRPTVLRKLKNLLKKKLLTKDKNNHYLIFGGPGTSNYSKDILKIMNEVNDVRKINGKELANLMTKILNIVVL